jgi:hypothetical protein
MTLRLLGIVSLLFVIAFTWHAYQQQAAHGQSPRSSIIEAWVNIAIGFTVNMLMNTVMFPLMTNGHHVTLEANWYGGWVYTAASILRQYAIRRWFNAALHRAACALTKEPT